MRFEDLQLIDPLLRAVAKQGYTEPTPIQQQAIPAVLAGRDVVGLAQTGTGKTAAFALPILQRLHENHGGSEARSRRDPSVLVIAPTRELAAQIDESFAHYGRYLPYRHTTVFGGVNQNSQVAALKKGVDIVVATPGRLLDLMNQRHLHLGRINALILDEADRMLDMGFLPDIKRILRKIPDKRQTLLFSATMPDDIQKLTREILKNPVEVSVTPQNTTVEAIEQRVYFVEKRAKRKLLLHLLDENSMHRTLVFTRTKRGANRLTEDLGKAKIRAEAIHGNKSQNARQRALDNFKRGKTQVLVATDIAARGIDVDDVSHVVNYDLPTDTENYVHRIGRTGRAGAEGVAWSFCASAEQDELKKIERLIQMSIPVEMSHPYLPGVEDLEVAAEPTQQSTPQNGTTNTTKKKRRRRKKKSNANPQS